MVMATKSQICSSTMGRMPATADPTPMPTKEGSEIGVSRTRSSPNLSRSPLDTWKMPPIKPTSSPMRKTRSSRLISWWRAALRASAKVISRSARLTGSVTRARGADTAGSMISTVGSGLSIPELLEPDLLHPPVGQPPLDAGHRILLHPLELFLLGAVVGEIGPHAVTAPAIGHRLHAAGPLAAPCPRHRLAHRLVHGKQIIAVHASGRDAVGARAHRHAFARRGARLIGGERVLVVLADEDEGQLPDGGQVHGLVDHALVGAAVTEEGDDDAIGLAKLVGEGGAGADGHTRGHDAVGA